MIETYDQNIQYLAEGQLIVVGENTTATIQVATKTAAWGTAVLTVYRSNFPQGPFLALSTPVTLSAVGFSAAIDCTGFGYMRIDVTTAEAANETLAIGVCLKRNV